MAMSLIWTVMVGAAILCGLATGNGPAVAKGALDGAAAGVELSLSMMGVLCLWMGVMEVMERSGIARGLSRLLRVPQDRRGMWCCCATFCNNGFMGFPVALALFGEEGRTLTVILSIPFNLLIYSMGAKLVCMDLPQNGSARPISWSREVFSVTNLAMAVGLFLYFTQLQLPQAILGPWATCPTPPPPCP